MGAQMTRLRNSKEDGEAEMGRDAGDHDREADGQVLGTTAGF